VVSGPAAAGNPALGLDAEQTCRRPRKGLARRSRNQTQSGEFIATKRRKNAQKACLPFFVPLRGQPDSDFIAAREDFALQQCKRRKRVGRDRRARRKSFHLPQITRIGTDGLLSHRDHRGRRG
jgi:hypothetical protein